MDTIPQPGFMEMYMPRPAWALLVVFFVTAVAFTWFGAMFVTTNYFCGSVLYRVAKLEFQRRKARKPFSLG